MLYPLTFLRKLLVRVGPSAETPHQAEEEQIGANSFLILYKGLSMSIAIHTIFKDLVVQCAEGKGTERVQKGEPKSNHTVSLPPGHPTILKKMLIQ